MQRIRANSAIEHLDRKIRRRTGVVDTFPDGNSTLMLVTTRLKHVSESRWNSRRYLDVTLLEGWPHRTVGLGAVRKRA